MTASLGLLGDGALAVRGTVKTGGLLMLVVVGPRVLPLIHMRDTRNDGVGILLMFNNRGRPGRVVRAPATRSILKRGLRLPLPLSWLDPCSLFLMI